MVKESSAPGIPSSGGCTGSPAPRHVVSHLGHALGTGHIRCVGEVGGDAAGEATMNASWVLKERADSVVHSWKESTGPHGAAAWVPPHTPPGLAQTRSLCAVVSFLLVLLGSICFRQNLQERKLIPNFLCIRQLSPDPLLFVP